MYVLFPHCLAVVSSSSKVGNKSGGKGLICLMVTLYHTDDDADACS